MGLFPLFVKSLRDCAIKIQLEDLISTSATSEAGSQGSVSFHVSAGRPPLREAANIASFSLDFESCVYDVLWLRSDSRAQEDTTRLPCRRKQTGLTAYETRLTNTYLPTFLKQLLRVTWMLSLDKS